MFATAFLLVLFIECVAEDYYYNPHNISRSTLSGIAAYRSSLTLDWLAAEDTRQRELALAFETDATPVKAISTECIAYPRPAPGKIGRLMLEVLKNLEGDDGTLVPELIQVLIRTKILVETSILETEPDLESLVKTPGMMMGEPHTTFPRILAAVWMLVTDPTTIKKHGWCPIQNVNQYLRISKPYEIAKQMRTLELVVARARFIMEEFIQNITPVNMYQKKTSRKKNKIIVCNRNYLPKRQVEEYSASRCVRCDGGMSKAVQFKNTCPASQTPHEDQTTQQHAIKQRAHEMVHFPHQFGYTHPTSSSEGSQPGFEVLDGNEIVVTNACPEILKNWKVFVALIFVLK